MLETALMQADMAAGKGKSSKRVKKPRKIASSVNVERKNTYEVIKLKHVLNEIDKDMLEHRVKVEQQKDRAREKLLTVKSSTGYSFVPKADDDFDKDSRPIKYVIFSTPRLKAWKNREKGLQKFLDKCAVERRRESLVDTNKKRPKSAADGSNEDFKSSNSVSGKLSSASNGSSSDHQQLPSKKPSLSNHSSLVVSKISGENNSCSRKQTASSSEASDEGNKENGIKAPISRAEAMALNSGNARPHNHIQRSKSLEFDEGDDDAFHNEGGAELPSPTFRLKTPVMFNVPTACHQKNQTRSTNGSDDISDLGINIYDDDVSSSESDADDEESEISRARRGISGVEMAQLHFYNTTAPQKPFGSRALSNLAYLSHLSGRNTQRQPMSNRRLIQSANPDLGRISFRKFNSDDDSKDEQQHQQQRVSGRLNSDPTDLTSKRPRPFSVPSNVTSAPSGRRRIRPKSVGSYEYHRRTDNMTGMTPVATQFGNRENDVMEEKNEEEGPRWRNWSVRRPTVTSAAISEARERMRRGTIVEEPSLQERTAAQQQLIKERNERRLASFMSDLTHFCDSQSAGLTLS